MTIPEPTPELRATALDALVKIDAFVERVLIESSWFEPLPSEMITRDSLSKKFMDAADEALDSAMRALSQAKLIEPTPSARVQSGVSGIGPWVCGPRAARKKTRPAIRTAHASEGLPNPIAHHRPLDGPQDSQRETGRLLWRDAGEAAPKAHSCASI